jgi:hypothetical protein
MKTAVEWLESEMLRHYSPFDNKLLYEAIHKAKEMFEKQIIEARNNGFMASAEGWNGEYGIKDFNLLTEEIKSEEYFNKTFKTK